MSQMTLRVGISFAFLVLVGCSQEVPDVSEFEIGMSKERLLEEFGEPSQIKLFSASDSSQLVEIVVLPENEDLTSIFEMWSYPATNRRITFISDNSPKTGRVDLMFSYEDSSDMVAGFGWQDADQLARSFRDDDT